MTVAGDQPMNFTRQFLLKEKVYEMRIPSRGYLLLWIRRCRSTCSKANIMGDAEEADHRLRPQARREVSAGPPPPAPDSPEAKAGGGGGGEE